LAGGLLHAPSVASAAKPMIRTANPFTRELLGSCNPGATLYRLQARA
jgi:hypothetical protein